MDEFHPAVQTAIRYYADHNITMQALANEQGKSKQAISKQIKKG
jgi:predicted DNA-binding protein YlxM (UPF0122 family)